MNSNYGHNINFTLFGESHGPYIGITINNLPAGIQIDFDSINKALLLRQGNASFNTSRQEKIDYEIISGYFENKTTNHPLTVLFPNKNIKSKDYEDLKVLPRGGHVDVVASKKYKESFDYRGSGHFSGRMTTPLVFLGFLLKQILKKDYPDLKIISHIKSFASYTDITYYVIREKLVNSLLDHKDNLENLNTSQLSMLSMDIDLKLHYYLEDFLNDKSFPVFDENIKKLMIEQADALINDTLGGQVESIILNPPINLGEPFFSSFESILSSLIFSIPSIKGINFGNDKDIKDYKGSTYNDEIIFVNKHKLTTLYNNNGGINGGISNGEDIVFTTLIKPITSNVSNKKTYHLVNKKIDYLKINGRHDKTIINRIIPIIEAMAFITLYELLIEHTKKEL